MANIWIIYVNSYMRGSNIPRYSPSATHQLTASVSSTALLSKPLTQLFPVRAVHLPVGGGCMYAHAQSVHTESERDNNISV